MPLEQFVRDLRFGFRHLRGSPGFTLVALLSLALGIGVNAAIFTLLNGLVLETLPAPHPERLVEVEAFNSYPFFRELAARNTIFEDVTAQFGFSIFELQPAQRRERLNGIYVSGTYFDFLHASPYLGRLLTQRDDEISGAQPVCVLSYQLWRGTFGGNPKIIGTTIRINDRRVEVAGVTKPRFTGLDLQNAPDIELPTSAVDSIAQSMHRDDTSSGGWQIMARLKPGIIEQSAQERFAALAKRVTQSFPPNGHDALHENYRLNPAPRGFDEQTGMARPLIVLMSTVGVVLLIACLNLANLLLARGQRREREVALRASLGAAAG